jgi:hypothetical protein
MGMQKVLASALMVTMVAATMPAHLGAQSASINGTAKNEVKMPYADYTIRVRNVMTGAIVSTVVLDGMANWAFQGLSPADYVVELVKTSNMDKVICSEGPFDLVKQQLTKSNVNINCNNHEAAWWLLGGAAAAGITAGVVKEKKSKSK